MDIDYIRENFMTAPQAAQYLGITRNRVGRLCLEGRFIGAGKIDDMWLIPREAVIEHRRLKPGELKGGGANDN
ncbi:MAG: helix-turn-helix domain-containing protein [Synergistaceae bacterium]|nr:helix-turn-helix domain-containing protein [Synergistaceae bacterium]